MNILPHFLPLLVFVLVAVLVELELMVSESLLVLEEVAVFVIVCVMVGLFVFVCVTVTLVFGDPISDIAVDIGTFCEATQASPAPSPVEEIFIRKCRYPKTKKGLNLN